LFQSLFRDKKGHEYPVAILKKIIKKKKTIFQKMNDIPFLKKKSLNGPNIVDPMLLPP